ncbi:putative Ring finger protein [Quillaja saponaria]|uniref:Ring finger protein n=1 Tax=Quillaja saponaria TaxID=32244 RepID=A0AAD7LGE7_QUISA|nr:putative Ring finger protein [Quillaja saponaria]
MGTSSSRLESRPSRPRVNSTNCFTLSSLLCGGSTSHATYEMDDHPAELRVESQEDLNPLDVTEGLSLTCCTQARFTTSPNAETGTSSDCSNELSENSSVEDGSGNVATSNQRKCLSESKELVPPHQVRADHNHDESHRDSRAASSTSFVERQSSSNKDAVHGVNNSVDKGVPQVFPAAMHPSSSSPQGLGNSSNDEIASANQMSQIMAVQSSDSHPVAEVSNLPVNSQLLGDESFQETIPSGLGFLVSNREEERGDGNVLHVDVVTISSNILSSSNSDIGNHESRRNGRRLFWDAFSRRSSRRHGDSPTIVFSTGDSDDPGSRDRWLLDLSNGFVNDGIGGEPGYLGNRIHRLNERRRHSRSEIWERLRGGLDEIGRWNTSCPLGLHPDGMCSCESFPMTEESSTRASISRIVMLAEALFEVLDEIHRQPVSLSLSMVSTPAPESIVDSFPLKSHKKVDIDDGSNDVEQCYICLAEYEEGDRIRILPCHHEYHMSCVDKWLKEIHGVCPLCRGNVCGGLKECSASSSEVSSQ